MPDLRQTSEYSKYMKSIGWFIDGKQGNYSYIKKFPLIGSFIKIQRPEKIDLLKVRNLEVKYRAFQVVIEPKNQYQASGIKNHGFKQLKSYFVPSKTIHIDLIKSEKQLLREMHYKTRYNINKGIKNNELRIKYSNNIEQFANFWQKCALEQRGMFLNQKKEIIEIYSTFGKSAHIIEVRHKSPSDTSEVSDFNFSNVQSQKLLASILMICTKNTAYYMYAASTAEGKKLFAPTIAAWEAVKLAKKLKKSVFDFEGIYDDRFPQKSWLGFTRFKKSFGGREITHPGSFTKFRLPV